MSSSARRRTRADSLGHEMNQLLDMIIALPLKEMLKDQKTIDHWVKIINVKFASSSETSVAQEEKLSSPVTYIIDAIARIDKNLDNAMKEGFGEKGKQVAIGADKLMPFTIKFLPDDVDKIKKAYQKLEAFRELIEQSKYNMGTIDYTIVTLLTAMDVAVSLKSKRDTSPTREDEDEEKVNLAFKRLSTTEAVPQHTTEFSNDKYQVLCRAIAALGKNDDFAKKSSVKKLISEFHTIENVLQETPRVKYLLLLLAVTNTMGDTSEKKLSLADDLIHTSKIFKPFTGLFSGSTLRDNTSHILEASLIKQDVLEEQKNLDSYVQAASHVPAPRRSVLNLACLQDAMVEVLSKLSTDCRTGDGMVMRDKMIADLASIKKYPALLKGIVEKLIADDLFEKVIPAQKQREGLLKEFNLEKKRLTE